MKTNTVKPSRFFYFGKLNLSLVALCVASTFTTHNALSAEVLWTENFDDSSLNNKGAIYNTLDMSGVSRWSIDVSNAQLTASSDWFKVSNGKMEARDVDGSVIWLSETIDILGKSDINLSVLAEETGNHEAADYFDLFYSVDNAPYIKVENWQGKGSSSHTLIDDFTAATIAQAIPQGNSLQVKVEMSNNAGSEYIRLDEVLVSASNTGDDDNGDGNDNGTVIDACYNCPDLSRIANAAEFDDTAYYETVFNVINAEQSAEVIRTNINDVISANHKQLSYSEAWTA
jgi:hypothetical protein